MCRTSRFVCLCHTRFVSLAYVKFLNRGRLYFSNRTRCGFVQFIFPCFKLIDLSFICVFAWLFPILIVLCSVMQHININVRAERPNPGLKWRYSIFREPLIVKVVIIEFE